MALTPDQRQWLLLAGVAFGVMAVLAVVSADGTTVSWNYLSGILLLVVVYALLALGLSLEFGHTGLLNLGHVGFMLIGAYTYGILMMPAIGRPDDAPGIVGALFDAAPSFEGATTAGFLMTGLVALVAGVLVAIPVLLVLSAVAARFAPAWAGTRSLVAGAVAGLIVAVIVFAAAYPLGPTGALNVAVVATVLIGMAVAGVAGVLLGLPTLRLREDYLAIVTLGAAEILRSVVLNEEAWTRGSRTIVNYHRPIVDWALENESWRSFVAAIDLRPASFAVLVAGVLALIFVFLILETLARSPWGRVLRAIREDEEATASLGKNVLAFKLQSLMVGSAIAALAGVLLVTAQAVVTPVMFLPIVTFNAFMIVVIGGVGTHRGAIAGAFLLWGVFALAQNLSALKSLGLDAGPPQTILIGVLLVSIMMFRPQGLLGSKEELAHAK